MKQNHNLIDLKNLLMNEATMCTLKTLDILHDHLYNIYNSRVSLLTFRHLFTIFSIIHLIYILYIGSLYTYKLTANTIFKTMEILLII